MSGGPSSRSSAASFRCGPGTGQRSNTRRRLIPIPRARPPPPRGVPTLRRARCGVYSMRPPANRVVAIASEHAEVALRPKRRRPSKKNPHRDRQGQVTRRSPHPYARRVSAHNGAAQMSPIPDHRPAVPRHLPAPQSALCTAADRDQFIARVHAELRGQPIGDGSIGRAIRIVQASFPHPEPERKPHVRPWARADVSRPTPMAYWTAARFQMKHERLALHFLRLLGLRDVPPAIARAEDPTRSQGQHHPAVVSRLCVRRDRASMARRPPGTRHARASLEWRRTGACAGQCHCRATSS